MPELGETWSVAEMGNTARSDAVVIATGPSMIRLVSRTGRRITFPTASWGGVWRFEHAPPLWREPCHRCPSTAYFRFAHAGGSLVWTCEEHLPFGVRAHFPGDALDPSSSTKVQMHCPECDSARVEVNPKLTSLPRQRMTTRYRCEDCNSEWSPLVSRGLGDDGMTLASDLHDLFGSDSATEVRIGFTAYRALCRALGMGDVPHIHGVRVTQQPTLADLLTLVFFTTRPAAAETPAEAAPPWPGFSFVATEILPFSYWQRRFEDQVDASCRLLSIEPRGRVVVQMDGAASQTTLLQEFLLNWMPAREERTPSGTVWRHVETGRLVQIVESTQTQRANHQVAYVTFTGQHETTPQVTFLRLYQEMPTPPENYLWSFEGEVFRIEREDRKVRAYPLDAESQIPPRELGVMDLYAHYEWFVDHHGTDDSLRASARWASLRDPSDVVTVLGVGSHVRFVRGDEMLLSTVDSFRTAYVHVPEAPPCAAGETWVHCGRPNVRATIVENTLGHALVRWLHTGEEQRLSHAELVKHYQKLDIRSYWEILDDQGLD